jgi:hypothetical protein
MGIFEFRPSFSMALHIGRYLKQESQKLLCQARLRYVGSDVILKGKELILFSSSSKGSGYIHRTCIVIRQPSTHRDLEVNNDCKHSLGSVKVLSNVMFQGLNVYTSRTWTLYREQTPSHNYQKHILNAPTDFALWSGRY